MKKHKTHFRDIPSVDAILNHSRLSDKFKLMDYQSAKTVARRSLVQLRESINNNEEVIIEDFLEADVNSFIEFLREQPLQPVINGTGVILHTNLGRAPISQNSMDAVISAGLEYSALEVNLSDSTRGGRNEVISTCLSVSTGCERGFIVNNNASATLLALSTMVDNKRNEVIVSRGESVEIGGGFRIPDIITASGAKIIEVGTTNKTYISDYSNSITNRTAAILKVHTSNFIVKGFVHTPKLIDIAKMAKTVRLPLIHDIGSGCLVDTRKYGLTKEPMVQDSVTAGVDLTLFSGDKLLGGIQSGLIVGEKSVVSRMESHPLARAFRTDKLTLASTISTIKSYIKGSYEDEIPIWKIVSQSIRTLERRANTICKKSEIGTVIDGSSVLGGGSMPDQTIPTKLIRIDCDEKTQNIQKQLVNSRPCIMPRISDGKVYIDVRTVLETQDDLLINLLIVLWGGDNAKKKTSS